MNIRKYSSFLFSSFGNFEVKASNRARITRQLEDERRSKFKVAREIAFFLTRCRIKRLRFGELVARLFKLSPPSFRTSRRGRAKSKTRTLEFPRASTFYFIYIHPFFLPYFRNENFRTRFHKTLQSNRRRWFVFNQWTNERTNEWFEIGSVTFEIARYIYIYVNWIARKLSTSLCSPAMWLFLLEAGPLRGVNP